MGSTYDHEKNIHHIKNGIYQYDIITVFFRFKSFHFFFFNFGLISILLLPLNHALNTSHIKAYYSTMSKEIGELGHLDQTKIEKSSDKATSSTGSAFEGKTEEQKLKFEGKTEEQKLKFEGKTEEQKAKFMGKTQGQVGKFEGKTEGQVGKFEGKTENVGKFEGKTENAGKFEGKPIGKFEGKTEGSLGKFEGKTENREQK